MVLNDTQLCFAVNLALLLDPTLSAAEALTRELHRLAGLEEGSLVTLSDVLKFKNVVRRKIVVYHQGAGEGRTLSVYETPYPHSSQPLFTFFFREHYYGIKNAPGLLGVRRVCNVCYKGYQQIEKHRCPGRCSLCRSSLCFRVKPEKGVCPDCCRFYRSSACFHAHKAPAPGSVLSTCEQYKNRTNCCLLYEGCKICGAKLARGDMDRHQCYIEKLPPQKCPTRGDK